MNGREAVRALLDGNKVQFKGADPHVGPLFLNADNKLNKPEWCVDAILRSYLEWELYEERATDAQLIEKWRHAAAQNYDMGNTAVAAALLACALRLETREL